MSTPALTWSLDVLEGFERAPTSGMTLVRPLRQPTSPTAVVLHVHGYNDYFFQAHLAEALVAASFAFYAVDLPRAGRSLREGDIPHFMADAAEQADAIDTAATFVSTLHPGVPLVVHAHSTSGLTAAIWAHWRPAQLAGLALNSPLFGFVGASPLRRAAVDILAVGAPLKPLAIVSRSPSVYARSQHISGGGRWEFDTAWKRPEGLPARLAWVAAVRRAQRSVARGLDITVPVLVAHSDSSGPDYEGNPLFDSQDTAVDVRMVARLAPRLGPDVSMLVVPGAVHELSLSREEPRQFYVKGLSAWIAKVAS